MSAPKIRQSLTALQAAYDNGDKAPLENLMRAWKTIKALPADDPNSFFTLGGFHGEPFRGEGKTKGTWWGGYCQHGTVLFPTWHRAYLHRLEKALQSVKGCEDVTLPFWDECSDDSKTKGIPRALTDEHFHLDGKKIENPLRSFKFPVAIVDEVDTDQNNPDSPNYSKHKGYETVRYPLSGLVGTAADRKKTKHHNEAFPDYDANVMTLNANIITWLKLPIRIYDTQEKAPPSGKTKKQKPPKLGLIEHHFRKCMDAPSYTLFSNTTSQGAWNQKNPKNKVTPLEMPHNFMHLAVGGYDVPNFDAASIAGANGDMGENDTAGLDPIFFFHHCFIDYAFWIWQRRHKKTKSFTIDPKDPGATYGANNPPPAFADDKKPMTLETPLQPFKKHDGHFYTSADCFDIEGQLGYIYGPGSLDRFAEPLTAFVAEAEAEQSRRTIHVAGLDRSKIAGSFLVAAYDSDHKLIDVVPFLSRWNVEGCSNCQTHLKATADIEVDAAHVKTAADVKVLLHTRGGIVGDAPPKAESAGQVFATMREKVDVPFTVEIR